MLRFYLASILWLTAIVAVAAAIPYPIRYTETVRAYLQPQAAGRVQWPPVYIEVARSPATLTEEILIRGLIALALLLIVWLGHFALHRIRRPKACRESVGLD
jgi:hypothetical protein